MAYDVIAFDMDGTLLRSDQTIDPRSVSAIERAKQAGKIVVLATGRAVSELAAYRSDLAGVRYGVTASGGLLYDFETEKVLTKKCLPSAVVEQIRSLLEIEEMVLIVMADGQGYLQTSHLDQLEQFHMGAYQQLYEETARFVPDLRDFLGQGEFEKINLYFKTNAERERVAQLFSTYPVSLARAEETGLELSAVGADKGTGLSQLCHFLNCDMTQVIGVGDADNDVTMFEQVGLGLAMGNANATIKGLAGAVLPDNNSGGCAVAIDHYLLS